MVSATALENKNYVKFLGVLIDTLLTWKKYIDYNSSKISKIVGPIARLRHHVPFKSPNLSITHISIYELHNSPLGPSRCNKVSVLKQLHGTSGKTPFRETKRFSGLSRGDSQIMMNFCLEQFALSSLLH